MASKDPNPFEPILPPPGFYDNAFDGSTDIGKRKGNREQEIPIPKHIKDPQPFTVRKRSR